MTKPTVFFFSMMISIALACGGASPSIQVTQPSTPGPVSTLVTSPGPESNPPPEESLATATGTKSEQTMSAPTGLRVVYIREGNLWAWTEAGGSVQLTDTGDMTTARLSNDSQFLAFMRGKEVWAVRMDGADARLLVTQKSPGGALWFAPNDSLLAVSTSDHIDVVYLSTSGSNTVASFPVIPDGYYPEVVWSPDASGFKTVIPPQTETGQAELLFVFPDGTLASLAKFALVPLSESLPFLSPDGGYVNYVAKTKDGKQSLYLMDSSGATKTYGQMAVSVRAMGWLPDSKHFIYTSDDPGHSFLGEVGGAPVEISLGEYQSIRWVDRENFLALQNGNLFLGDARGGGKQIDSSVIDFDFNS